MPFPCRAHAVPLRVYIVSFKFYLDSEAVFNLHKPWRARAMPRPCRSERDFSRPRHSAAGAWHGMCILASSVQRRHMGDLAAFGFFRVPRGIHTDHAAPMPFPLPRRAAKGLGCVFPTWFTQLDRVWFTRVIPCPCHAKTMQFWEWLLKATTQRGKGASWAWRGMCEIGNLPSFGFFRLPRGVQWRLLSEAYQFVKL
jgi:hypothetical protein